MDAMPKKEQKLNLPGDAKMDSRIARMLRVNHAGEYGARQIYRGQLKVLKGTRHEKLIREMAAQEEKHLAYFAKEIPTRHVRPTALLPIWHVAGYALGAATALLGPRAAMACTVAVEEVIDEHYARQEKALSGKDEKLKEAIAEFREEENEHKNIGIHEEAELAPGYEILSAGIKTISKAAIWLSERV